MTQDALVSCWAINYVDQENPEAVGSYRTAAASPEAALMAFRSEVGNVRVKAVLSIPPAAPPPAGRNCSTYAAEGIGS